MSRERPVDQVEINDDLEAARSLSKEEFLRAKDETNGDGPEDLFSPEWMSGKQWELFRSVVELAQSIKQKELWYPVTCRQVDDGLELITGYRRYLACVYIGRPVRFEVKNLSDGEVLDMIYSENEQRRNLSGRERAIVIAKRMGLWDPENEELLSEQEAEDGMSIAEFAQETGKNRGLIYQHLSPLRQSRKMRDDFGDCLTESSMQLIESISQTEEQQYTIAQALTRSDVDTFSSFESKVKLSKKQAETREQMIHRICRSLLGVRNNSVEGSYVPPNQRRGSSIETTQRHEEELQQQESQEQRDAGHSMERGSGTDVPDIEVNDATNNTQQSGGGMGSGQTGTGVLPESEQGFSDRPLDIQIEGDVAQTVRELAHETDRDANEIVEDALESHYRRVGELTDTPAAEMKFD